MHIQVIKRGKERTSVQWLGKGKMVAMTKKGYPVGKVKASRYVVIFYLLLDPAHNHLHGYRLYNYL